MQKALTRFFLLFDFSVIEYPSDNLTVIVEPSSGILRAMWARSLLTAGLIDSYLQLLSIAETQSGCRLWHFDLRLSIWPAATFMHWLSDIYAPLAPRRLGGKVYLACWVSAQHQAHVEEALTAAVQHRMAAVGFHLTFFIKEPEARAWLLHQQAQEADN